MNFIHPFQKFLLIESNSEEGFSFSELSPEIQSEVLDNFKEKYTDHLDGWWYEDVISNFESELKDLGFEDVECNFTGFWSQGDGASFTGRVRDVEKFFKEALNLKPNKWFVYKKDNAEEEKDEFDDLLSTFQELGLANKVIPSTPDDFWINIERSTFSRYYHENTIQAEVDLDEPVEGRGLSDAENRELNKWLESLSEEITAWARKKSSKLYSDLEHE